MNSSISIIYSTADQASVNIRDALLSNGMDRALFHELDTRLIHSDFPEKKLELNGGALIFLSRHSSEKKVNSLTVHPVGNFSTAELGGNYGEVAPCDPWVQSAILRSIKESYVGNKYQITFEATHHGPRSESRIMFAEIGTGPENWEDSEALGALAAGIRRFKQEDYPNYIAAGGGHYAPKFTDAAMEMKINIGHIISKYRMDDMVANGLQLAFDSTPECKGFILDRKGLRSGHLEAIRKFCSEKELDMIEL